MPTPAKYQGTGNQVPEAGNEERWNSFDGVTDRQVSRSPNNVNASESSDDQQPIVALLFVGICLLVRKHPRLIESNFDDQIYCPLIGSQISFPKIEHHLIQMQSSRQIVNAVFAHRVAHHFKFLAGGHERVDKRQLIVWMDIVVISAVHHE